MSNDQSIFGKSKCPHCSVTVFLYSSLAWLTDGIYGEPTISMRRSMDVTE